ncbi:MULTISPECIES: LysE family translocator [Caulobacter]|jgi:threonine/homoserine/homoserine lactone efflux protein|uniref:Putative threonine efflux protein n=1 Tax=Caulobacter vibrioides OR37 TaxID=1292034 RepID=R0EKD6_CAUVI|nr:MULTISPECIES: LysE family translocator [Caulobacter]ENZ82409.1 putative threonine efflux protein [Caulobacter vibrioides OR37]MBQ1560290.1 LysE family translocator [Caulobacter sp.]
MPEAKTWIAFVLICLGMALTPGPNMLYVVSRSISQGRWAGVVSLIGTAAGFIVYLVCASLGITALLMAAPIAYDVLRFGGALYLGWLAWHAIKPGAAAPFQVRDLPKDSPRKLIAMGFLTNLLNPKAAMLYLSLLPQFIHPEHGHVLTQSLALGLSQILVSMTVNGTICFAAGTIAAFLSARPGFALIQRWLMATVLGGLALRMATEARGR